MMRPSRFRDLFRNSIIRSKTKTGRWSPARVFRATGLSYYGQLISIINISVSQVAQVLVIPPPPVSAPHLPTKNTVGLVSQSTARRYDVWPRKSVDRCSRKYPVTLLD